MRSEAETREELIDRKLHEAGWDVSHPGEVTREYPIHLEGEVEYADYVLLGRDGKPLAVVEAKKTSIDAAVGKEQSKQYCEHIQMQTGGILPFCFFTNGLEIFFWDLGNYPPRKVTGYPTRDDLERYLYIREHKKPLSEELINTNIAGRDYQIRAIRSVMEGITKKRRDFLLVMATGTGKTRTIIALVDALMRAGQAVRVLFLVDRIALREQGLAAFKEHLPDEPRWPKTGETILAKDRRIYVSTYPTMLNIIRDEENRLSPHFFDLVIVDESHRSIYNTYGEVIQYFRALTVGLTATPTDVIDHNTFRLFDCTNGLPTYAFTYEEAVNHIPPYLNSFRVMKIHSKFQDEGINKRTITLEDQKKLILEGKEVAEINFEGSEIEKTVVNRGTNALIVREFMEESIKDPDGVLPGKTIFFCSSKAHTRRMQGIFDDLYPEYQGELAQVLVSEDPRVYGKGGLLDQFSNRNMPRIALSVDMLDTGIDIREIVNLVFAKPVFSYTKFWQMIGRGTRLLEENKIKPWCPVKDYFLILDCWDNFEYFKLNPKGKENPVQTPLPVRFFGVRLDKIGTALTKGEEAIARKEAEKLRAQIESLPARSVIVQEAAANLERTHDPSFWVKMDHEKIAFLRENVKPLFRAASQGDFTEMRFEKDLLEASLAKLSGEEKKYQTLASSIAEEISELPLSVNVVAREEEMIRLAQTESFWAKAEDGDFDRVGQKLKGLMTYRDGKTGPTGPMKLDLRDSVKTKEWVEFGPEHSAVSVAQYREMVEKLVKQLTETNPILQKIRDGKGITEAEAAELAETLHEESPHITEDLLQTVYQNRKAHFLQFIRHILGLERLASFPETVEKAFEGFLKAHSDLNSRQLDFLNLLREFILDKEKVEKKDLISSPFTKLHPDGIRGLFNPREIEEILEMTKKAAA